MPVLELIETKLEKLQSRTILPILAVVLLGLILRIYFTPWHLSSSAPDALVYLIEGLAYTRGDFSYFSSRFLWPAFLSVFVVFFKFDDYLGYMTVIRAVSISVSVATIPILYLISKQFVEKKYAIAAAAFFAIEANIVENSTFAITEPMFILLGLVSFYFIVQKNEKYMPLAFVFAGLSFDTRLNGVVLFLLLVLTCAMKIRPKMRLTKILLAGTGIFLATSFPHLYVPLSQGEIPFLFHFTSVGTVVSHGETFTATYIPSETQTTFSILKTAFTREFLHVFRISVPYLAILAPIGFIVALKDLDFQKKIMFATIIISLIIALPQYTISAEYRNLFFITPFFSILSAIGIQKLWSNIEMKNIFLILLIAGLLLVSFSFLRDRYESHIQQDIERELVGKYVVNNFVGRIMGNEYNQISHNIAGAKIGTSDGRGNVFNDKLSIVVPMKPVDTAEKLIQTVKTLKVDYLVVDNEYDRRYAIFQDVFYNEKNYPYLKKVFDSDDSEYKKIRVKIFEIVGN